MSCNCNKPKCDGKCGISPSVLQINNPGDCTLFHRVEVPASMGDSTTNPPKNGDYRNVLLYFVADGTSWLFSSDGIPQKLVSGFTDYEDAINLPQINGVTLLRNKTGEELGLQNKLTAGDGIEISSNNTISISDIEQYAHFFDTVADMKAATNLTNGSYAKTLGYATKNDGGDATYKIRTIANDDVVDDKFIIGMADNTLVGELVIENRTINVLCIGAGVSGHFAECVNYAIAKSNYRVYVPKGSYAAESTINFTANNIIFECDGNIYCGNFSPLFLVTNFRNVIRVNGRCFGMDRAGSVFMQIGDNSHSSMSHNIYFHTANDFDYGIVCTTGNNEGVAYNTVVFDLIDYNKVGILLQTSDIGANYITENNFTGGRIAGSNTECIGIQTIKGANQTDPYNGNVFSHIAIDGNSPSVRIKHFISLSFAYKNFFDEMRLFEALGDDYAIVLKESTENHFSAKYAFDVSKISDDSNSDVGRNYFEDGLRSGASFRTNTKFFTQFGKCIMEKDYAINPNLSVVSAYNTTTFTLPDSYVIGGTTVKVGYDTGSGTQTFVLPPQISKRCVNRFILIVTYKPAGLAFVLNDADGNEVATIPTTTSTLSRKSYMVEFTGNTNDSNIKSWKVTPLDYTIV